MKQERDLNRSQNITSYDQSISGVCHYTSCDECQNGVGQEEQAEEADTGGIKQNIPTSGQKWVVVPGDWW